MGIEEFIEDVFFIVAFLNIVLAIWSLIEWSIAWKINHSSYRWLYLLWILMSTLTLIVYLGITINTSPGNVLNAPWYMIAIRPLLTCILACSAVTAESMRFLRQKARLNGFK